MSELPPFPVDDGTLDLLWTALHPGPDADRTSLWDFLGLMSEMGGSDTSAIAEVVEEQDEALNRPGVYVMRDPQYTDHCVIDALITEVRRLRAILNDQHEGSKP